VRWAALSGIAFVAGVLIAIALFGSGARNGPRRSRRITATTAIASATSGLLHPRRGRSVFRLVCRRPLPRARRTSRPRGGTLRGTLLLGADALWAATAVRAQNERGFVLFLRPRTRL